MAANYSELEYKYRADHVKPAAFRELMKSLEGVQKVANVASWDIYYLQEGSQDSFQRFRMDRDRPELTKKVKTQQSNNWVRLESDLPLDPARASEDAVAFHVGLDGYVENFRIYKTCAIYFTENLNFVYYTVLNEDMELKGRFIEVEVNKDRVEWLEFNREGGALEELRQGEKVLEELGITAQNRLKKSLFELFRKL